MTEMFPLKSADAAYMKISGMLSTLGDPFTRIISPKEYQSFRIGSNGNLQGVGLFINTEPRTGHLVVLSCVEGGPAARAGLHQGDELVEINAPHFICCFQVKLSGSISSQYLTALLMAAPLALQDVEIEIIDKLISIPYVEMTLKLMERFGVSVEHSDSWDRFLIRGGQKYKSPGNAFVEGDASSASYFLAGAAVTGGTVTVEGCGTSSLQGDVKFAEVLEKMGAKVTWTENSVTVTGPQRLSSGGKHLKAVDVNMNKMPDVAMTLAVVALFADGPTAIRDVASWRVKETERMIAICTELRKLGATVEEGPDYCIITPPEKLNVTAIDTYDDHRMAMAFSLAACGDVPVTIKDPGCTRKTFPDYFEVLRKFTKH